MTTVVIGKQKTEAPVQEASPQEPAAPEKIPEPERKPYIRYSAPSARTRRIPLRAVLIAQLLIAAAAGLFVHFGTLAGSEELKALIAEAVRGMLNG